MADKACAREASVIASLQRAFCSGRKLFGKRVRTMEEAFKAMDKDGDGATARLAPVSSPLL